MGADLTYPASDQHDMYADRSLFAWHSLISDYDYSTVSFDCTDHTMQVSSTSGGSGQLFGAVGWILV